MLSDAEKTLIRRALKGHPPPQCFDLLEAPDPKKAERVWSGLERRGYVRIANFARCGFERVPGRYVTITEAGREAVA